MLSFWCPDHPLSRKVSLNLGGAETQKESESQCRAQTLVGKLLITNYFVRHKFLWFLSLCIFLYRLKGRHFFFDIFIDYAITVVPFPPFTQLHPAHPLPPTFPPYSSCPWVILISSLASTFPTLFLPSPCLFSTSHLCCLFSRQTLSTVLGLFRLESFWRRGFQ